MTPHRFVDQVDALVARGYRFIGEDEFFDALEHRSGGRIREVLLTFDDGYEEIHDVYLQCLAPRGIPVLVFLVTDYAGRGNEWDLSLGRAPSRHLSWAQVAAMAARGARFGSHGATHIDLTRASREGLDREITGSRLIVRERTGAPVRSFSYPFGRTNAAVAQAVQDAGYDGAFSLYPPRSNEYVDRFALRRNGVYIIDTNSTIRSKIERNPFFWFEEMKCRTINSVAVLTPLLKRSSQGRGT